MQHLATDSSTARNGFPSRWPLVLVLRFHPYVDVEAIQVQVYADANPDEDVEHPGEAGTMPQADLAPDAQGSGSLDPKVEGSKTERSSDPMNVALQHGQKRPDDPNAASTASSSKKFKPDTADVDPDLLHLLDDSDIGERVPKTPKLDDDVAKQLLNQVTSADLSLYEHEDENVTFPFTDNDLDVLEEYDWNLVDDEWLDGYDSFDSSALDDKEIIKQLTFPYSKHEPNLSDEELMRLDALADGVEIKRLVKMNVLTDAASVGESPKKLSTRFVRTWREKHDEKGQPIWLRRSRFVAREFAWLQPDTNALFSPASSSIVSRLLPTMFLDMRESFNAVMASMDFKDAFLTVEPKTPTVVDCVLADGQSISYGLGRVLPGQRDGSLMWYKDLTKMLKDDLGMVEHGPYPCILKTADSSCFVLIHVDDVLVVGRRDFVLGKMLECLKRKYEVSTQVIEKAGDELSFLKRRMVLEPDGRLLIQTHHKHVQQMCSLLGLNKKLQNKKTPGHADMEKDEHTGDLNPTAATTFRTCVGILLYLAADLPHCQHVVRHLSTYSSQPTEKSMTVLRHLVSYLASHDDICVSLKWCGRNAGLSTTMTLTAVIVFLKFSRIAIGQATEQHVARSRVL